MPDARLRYPDRPLSDGRICLRRWREADVECVRLAGTDPRIPRGTTVPDPFTPTEGLAFIHRQWSRAESGEGLSQAVVEVDSGRAVGLLWVALRPQPHVGGLGYWIIPPARGQGLATAAVRLVVPWALDVLNLRRLEAWVEPDNVASQRVLRDAGFQLEGRLRNFITVEDRPSDALVFSVIPPEP
ncbi:GNAT family N-acetyltransferase [Terrabacter sp. NPDC080008]|uniref:GNAT family N-acetyltransferase n=1 Tax=Terrabacter sp. NPDC080008 TaxID=3155176 RepID=UPI00344FECEA